MRRMAVFLSFLAAAMTLCGCNTIQGVGRDIKGAGRAIERSAE